MKYTQIIDGFIGEYRWLSNFWIHDTHNHLSVEHHYQAAKATNHEDWLMIMSAETPGKAKRLGRKIRIRDDWEDVKVILMEQFVREKFALNYDLRCKLLDTRGSLLLESNNWNDTYWGICNGVGENRLGKIIMKVRDNFL